LIEIVSKDIYNVII